MTKEEALNTLMKMRAWREWGKEQKEEERPEMPEQKEVDEAFDVCIEMLSRPSIPSNLDEAAEEWAKIIYGNPGKSAVSISGIYGFKAGAEWMAGQGETVEGYIAGTNEVAAILAIPRKEHNKGDEVVVQIRKK